MENSSGRISTLIIDTEVIQKIENDVDVHDLTSLVFLLYPDPVSAFQKILLLQRAGKTTSLLEPWLLEANSRSTWKHEFLQALSMCQLYHVIRELGLNEATVKQQYHPDNAIYLNLPKIMLYRLCENITSANLKTLKDTLSAQNIDTAEYKTCELILLKLMKIKFIAVDETNTCDLEKLVSIVENECGMKDYADILKELQSNTTKQKITSDVSNSEEFYEIDESVSTDTSDESMWDQIELTEEDLAKIDLIEQSIASGNFVKSECDPIQSNQSKSNPMDTESTSKNESAYGQMQLNVKKELSVHHELNATKQDAIVIPEQEFLPKILHVGNNSSGNSNKCFKEEFITLGQCEKQENIKKLKSNKARQDCMSDRYPIKNPNRIGFCFIINQRDFQPAEDFVLKTRIGSHRDVQLLDGVMRRFKFETYHLENLNHKDMLESIKDVIKEKVLDDDSIFMLCLLSHGVQGCVYASDSVRVKVNEIQNIIGDELRRRRLDIPKLMIIQACQVVDEPILVADSPLSTARARKSDFLICWATAPELDAYRLLSQNGQGHSIFIEKFCKNIFLYAHSYHLLDILVKVNCDVAEFCDSLTCDQVSKFDCYLRKDLYLQVPTCD